MAALPSVVVLTGAGISAESGIPTFRASDGLWENHRIEDVATPEAFHRNPSLVQSFYNLRRRHLSHDSVQPNPAHKALAHLEMTLGEKLFLITQNVDNLHERAGHRSVCHMHGELLKIRCTYSGKIFLREADVDHNETCACCQKSGTLRPHIVWFGEVPLYMDDIQSRLERCDVFVAIGTSGQVYPAAAFGDWAPRARKIEVNLASTPRSPAFHEHRIGSASAEVPRLVKELTRKSVTSF